MTDLTLTRHYYCDVGPYRGKYYVRLEGYVTHDALAELVNNHRPDPQTDSPDSALPINPLRGGLADLLEAGLLQAGEQLHWDRRNKGLRHTARLRHDGRLELADGTIWANPTRATTALGGSHHNGWKAWRRTTDSRTLDELRTELQARNERKSQ